MPKIPAGVLPVLATPFNQDGDIDGAALASEIDFVIQHHAHGVVLGMVSEILRLSSEERDALAEAFDAGMVRVNAPTSGVDFHAPFGGAKQSSYGPREQGLAARDFYTETRTVTIVP